MNPEQRLDIVNNLVAEDDGPWDEEDRELLNTFSDDKLTTLMGYGKHKKKKMPKVEEDEEDEEEEEEEVENVAAPRPQQMSPEEWFEQAPESVKNTFKYAAGIEQEQRDRLINQLTANLSGAEKQAHTVRLQNRSIEDLKADLSLVPAIRAPQEPQTPQQRKQEGWLGNALNMIGRHAEEEELLVAPTINWTKREPEDDGGMINVGMAGVTPSDEEAWMRGAPSRVKDVVSNALKIERRERDEVIAQLVTNVADPNERFRLRDRMSAKSLEELRDLLTLSRGSMQPAKQPANYGGAAAPTSNRLPTDEREDILPLPSINYRE